MASQLAPHQHRTWWRAWGIGSPVLSCSQQQGSARNGTFHQRHQIIETVILYRQRFQRLGKRSSRDQWFKV